jgi:hypothetical protein
MNYVTEIGSGAMVYIQSFIMMGSDIQNLIGVIHRQHEYRIRPLLFFKRKEIVLKIHLILGISFFFSIFSKV